MSELEKYIKQQIKEAKQVRLQEANADAEKKLKDLIAKGVSQSNEELEEEFPSGIGSKASHDAVHMTNPNAFKGLDRTINNIADTLTTGVADLLNISPDVASNVILAAVPASVIVGLAAGAAKGRDREFIPDAVEKFILKFANKFRKAGKELEFGQGGTYDVTKKYDGEPYFKKFDIYGKNPRAPLSEAKNPLAQKMKEIENQGRLAALETKLAAVAEMIEETEGRLTRIDEDNEFRDMMDRNAVKEVRKQLKELERAQAKLQKEYDKAAGGRKKKEVMDEDLPVAEDAVDIAVDEIELEEDNFELSEDASTNLELKSMANKIYSHLKKSGYKVKLNKGNLKQAKSTDFNQYTEKDSWATVWVGDGSKPSIDILWKSTSEFATADNLKSGLLQAIPELKQAKFEKVGGMISIPDSLGLIIYPGKDSTLSESILRMQKLAGLITESDIQKKTSLNEETSNEELLKLLQSNPDKVYLNTGKWPRMNVKNFKTSKSKDKGQVIDFDSRRGEFWFFWTGEKYKDAPKNINDGTKIIGGFKLDGTQIWFTVMGGRAEKYLVARLQRPEFTSKPGEIDYLKVAQFGN